MDSDLPIIVQFLREHKSFAILSHQRPDGDSIGSSLALGCALKQLGKEISIYQFDPIPAAFKSLPDANLLEIKSRLKGTYDSLIILECNRLERTGLRNLKGCHVINIDHHPNTNMFGTLNWVDDSAAAVAELVYKLILALGLVITPAIAINLYAAILTDTGSFQFPNTTPKTFSIAADLASKGAEPATIARSVYMNQPHSRLKLLVEVLGTLQIHPTKPIAWITLTRDMLQRTGGTPDITEGFVNYPLSLNRVQIVAFLREQNCRETRVSLRSKNNIDVSEIAKIWGGGGHKNAAGLTISATLLEAKKQVIRELDERISK